MITTVMFDMGGTLEAIYSDEESKQKSAEVLLDMLKSYGLDPGVDAVTLRAALADGWVRYGNYRDATDIELKPVNIWCDYVLTDYDFPREALAPHCEEIAHMWEVTYYHRTLRPGVARMLEGLKSLGLKIGIISNTAALFQVFDVLEDYGIRDYMDDVTLSSVTGIRKPCVDIFTVSMRQLQSKPEECVYVGDTISRDVIGPRRAGIAKTIQIYSKLTAEKDSGRVYEFAPDYVVPEIYDVYPVLKEILGKA